MKANSRKILHGVAITNGLVVGRITRHHCSVQHFASTQDVRSPDQEWSSFLTAQSNALEQIGSLISDAKNAETASGFPAVMEGYELLITDIYLIEKVKQLIFEDHLDARTAIEKVFSEAKKKLNSLHADHLKEKTLDIGVCETFLLEALESERPQNQLDHLKDRIVVVAHPTPQDVIRFHQAGVAGIIAEYGSHLSHAAILARSFNIPCLFSVNGILRDARVGQTVILSSGEEKLILNPSRSELRKAEARRAVELMVSQKLRSRSTSTARTKDGYRIVVCANADGPTDSRNLLSFGAEGIGLLRTEFLHLTGTSLPGVQESTIFFRMTAASLSPKWVTVRLLDAGGDKPYPIGHSYPVKPYGMRGIRFLLHEKSILENQLQSIIRANTKGNLRILIPFVSDVDEVRQVKRQAEEIWKSLSAEERLSLHFPDIGAMIETPAACQLLDHLSSECDFLSIGSNDLTQHILCYERDQAGANRQFSSFHPAVLRTLSSIFDLQKRTDFSISLCGEIASDPVATELLIGLGCRQLSVRTASIPLIKDIIRNLDIAEAEKMAQTVLRMSTGAEEIQKFLTARYTAMFDYSLEHSTVTHRVG